MLEPGNKVVIAEDTVARGPSLREAAAVVREVGAESVPAMADGDRGGTCKARAAEPSAALVAVVGVPELGFDFDD